MAIRELPNSGISSATSCSKTFTKQNKTHSQRLALKFILLITSGLRVKNVLTVVMKRHREKSSPLEEIAVGGREWLLT